MNEISLEGVLQLGAAWLGRRVLSPESFHNQFGVWPAAARELHFLAPAGGSLEQLLQVLWWLKTYPTEEVLRNKGVSPYHFRINLWARLHALNNQLPEVLFGLCLRAPPETRTY